MDTSKLATTPSRPIAWGYVRVSTSEQFEHVSSIVAQCETIIRFADYKQIDLGPPKTITLTATDGTTVEVHARERVVFEAVSAYKTSFLKRKVASELYQRLQPGHHLIFAKLDRAFCGVPDMLAMVERFVGAKISFYFLDQSDAAYNDSAASEATITILGAIARMERRRKSERHKEAFEARRQQGRRRCHIPCFQEVVINGTRERKYLTRERDLQKQIFKWYNQGHNSQNIADHLYELGERIYSLSESHVKQWGDRPTESLVSRMIAAEFLIHSIAKDMGKSVDDELVLSAYRERWLRMRTADCHRFGVGRGGKRHGLPPKSALRLA